jgi:biopolymer transport protein ExbD
MNLIPMIDVMLVLLVIFMVVAMRVRQYVPVQIPPATTGPTPKSYQLVLRLLPTGGFALNDMPVPDRDLDATLVQAFQGRTAKLLFIKVEGRRTYQEVITTMDRARGAGVQVLALVPRN